MSRKAHICTVLSVVLFCSVGVLGQPFEIPWRSVGGGDIQAFTGCLLGGGSNCECADTDLSGMLDLNDVDAFVTDLLAGAVCP